MLSTLPDKHISLFLAQQNKRNKLKKKRYAGGLMKQLREGVRCERRVPPFNTPVLLFAFFVKEIKRTD